MNILFTTPILEYPAAGGPALRIENTIKALNSIGKLHIVYRSYLDLMGGGGAKDFYMQHSYKFNITPRRNYNRSSNNIIHFIERAYNKIFKNSDENYILKYIENNNIDVVWCGFGNISYELMKIVKVKAPNVKIICDTDSVWSRYILREVPYEEDSQRCKKIEGDGKKKKIEEQDWVDFCDVTTAVSEIDAEYYRSLTVKKDKIKIFSNVIDLKSYHDHYKEPISYRHPSIYVAGTFDYKSPMDKGTRWLVKHVWPYVKNEIPNAHLYIIGKGSREVLSDIEEEDITITGKLDTVLPYLKNADVVTVPLFFESGTRFKILEAAACHIPIVSTSLGAEGIPVKHGENILIADNEKEFAKGIIKLCENKEYAKKIADNAYQLIKENYSVENLIEEGKIILDYLRKDIE